MPRDIAESYRPYLVLCFEYVPGYRTSISSLYLECCFFPFFLFFFFFFKCSRFTI